MSDAPPVPTAAWYGAGESLERAVRALQEFVLEHPVAAQAIYRSLVAEGRLAATTAEGARRYEELACSPLVQRLREVWEPASFNLLEPDSDRQVPSGYLEALAVAAEAGQVEALLRSLARPGGGHGA